MLAEIHEQDATGEIARIYDEVRRLWGVPYVSAIQRHLATRPGVLEWAWEAVGPAFRSGAAQQAAASCVDGLTLAPLAAIPRDALAIWGMGDRAVADAKSVAQGFVRVAPVNMVFAGLIKALLEGKRGAGQSAGAPWTPPPALPAPPPMVDTTRIAPELRAVLMRFATTTDGTPFVPGLYRMLAHWPALLAHLATVLAPRLASADFAAAFDRIRAKIDAAVPGVLATLPVEPPARPRPSEAERAHFLSIGATYRKTSPELIVVGRLIADALA